MNDIPAFLDFEASGFQGYPIEVAWSVPDGSIESHLIRSAPGWVDWDPEAAAVHGITREVLKAEGRSVHEVASRLNATLRGLAVYTDAPAFDERWCRRLFEAAAVEIEFSFRQAFLVIPDVPGRMSELYKAARALAGPAHRAAADVRFLVELWRLASQESSRRHSDDSHTR
jgi:hypothetical protein